MDCQWHVCLVFQKIHDTRLYAKLE